MKIVIYYLFAFLSALLISRCAGTIRTIIIYNENPKNYKNAYIISATNSKYIKFKFGVITPIAYIPLPDNPAVTTQVIGNTDIVIKKELEKYGISAEIGQVGHLPGPHDLIIIYHDTWRWDFKKILDNLEIVFLTPDSNKLIARSTYNIYKNKEFHNFPTPEKEVPKMIKELLKK